MKKVFKTYSYRSLLADLYRSVTPYRSRFIIATLARVSADALYLYTVQLLARMIDYFTTYTPGQPIDSFWYILAGWSLSYIYVVTARQSAKYLCYTVAERAKIDILLRGLSHLNLLDLDWHEQENTGNKLKRIDSGGEGTQRLLKIWIDNVVEIIINFSGMIIILAFTDRLIALIMLLFLITYLCVVIPLSARASAAARIVSQHEEDISGLSFEILNNIRTVKAMGLFSGLEERLIRETKILYAAIRRRIRRFRSKTAIQSYWAVIFRVLAVVVIVIGITKGQYEVGFLVLFNFYFTTLRTSVEELSSISQEITIARYHLARLSDTFAAEPGIDNDAGKQDFPSDWRTISLRNVSFAYGDTAVLQNVTFDIHRGERLGLVGLSGAGKSTLFKLLLKEYESFTGDILFDGVSIRNIKKSSYTKHVSVVLQDTEVFNLSLRENITLGAAGADDSRLTTSLSVAHVTDFLSKLPSGIDTIIGEKGIKLSGGEKQRVGIARAIHKQPDILFLDEATSHLDLESEDKIKDSLHQFFQQVTAVVIAHRLTTIQEMDRILLLENGRLIESGSFAELSKSHGRFFELWQKQRL